MRIDCLYFFLAIFAISLMQFAENAIVHALKPKVVAWSRTCANHLGKAAIAVSLQQAYPVLAQSHDTPSKSIVSSYDSISIRYDELDKSFLTESLGIDALRSQAATYVAGNVLETAVGTGIQLGFYDWSQVGKYTGVDISPGMLQEANKKIQDINVAQVPVTLKLMNAEDLTYEDNQFDTVIDTFSLCVIEDPRSAVREMERVLKPGGRLILLENSRSNLAFLANIQDFLEPVITPMSKNCRWNDDVYQIAQGNYVALEYSDSKQFGTISLQIFKKLNR